MPNKKGLLLDCGLPVAILGLAISSAILQNNWLLYAMLGLTCVFVVLAAFDKVNSKVYPFAVFAIGLALLYQTTLIGPGLVGTDIHGEYYFYEKALDGWDVSIPNAYNTSIGSTVIAPFLTNTFGVPGYWIYKAVFPLLFAFVPVLLYFVFKKEFGDKTAFLSTFFFVSMLSWSIEMISLPRQMLSELMFAMMLFLIITSKMKLRYRVPLLLVCSVLGMMFHYAAGFIILFYAGCAFVFLLLLKRRTFPAKWAGVAVVVLAITFVGYYSSVASGEAYRSVVGSATARIESISPFNPEAPNTTIIVSTVTTASSSTSAATPMTNTPQVVTTTITTTKPLVDFSYLNKQERLVRTALGMDFMNASSLGKVFRILQYLTQLCIILGCVYLIRNRKQISAEYLVFAAVSVILILACLFWPRLSSMVNVTRLYHISLFLLAPACILGGLYIFRKPQILTLCLIIPYFLFTSGLVFEVTRQNDISNVDIPYSIALSHSRVDVAEVPTTNDIAVRDWAVSQNFGHMLADVHGRLLFCEKVWYDWELGSLEYYPIQEFYYKLENNAFKQGDLIFLSERNTTTRTVTFIPDNNGVTSGTRTSYDFTGFGFDKTIENNRILFRQGNALILEIM
jgi:uncharacterized membrane protein